MRWQPARIPPPFGAWPRMTSIACGCTGDSNARGHRCYTPCSIREGMFLGRVILPPHEKIMAISADRILLLHRSELGIETLGVYRIS